MSQPDIKYSIKVPGPAGADSEKGVGTEHSGWAEAARIDLIRRDYEERILSLTRRTSFFIGVSICLLAAIIAGIFIVPSIVGKLETEAYMRGLHNGAPELDQVKQSHQSELEAKDAQHALELRAQELETERYKKAYQDIQASFDGYKTAIEKLRQDVRKIDPNDLDDISISIDEFDTQLKQAEALYQEQLASMQETPIAGGTP